MLTKFKPMLQISNRLELFLLELGSKKWWTLHKRSEKEGLELEFSKLKFHGFYFILFIIYFFKSMSDNYQLELEFAKLDFGLELEFGKTNQVKPS